MTPGDIISICPAAADFAPWLAKGCAQFGISTARRQAHFLAQCFHESAGATRVKENLNYRTAARIQAVWPRRFPTMADAQPYVERPEALANKVYAARNGNGDEASGDGYRYRGRGLIQLTGKANYIKASQGLGVSDLLIKQPDLVAEPEHAALTACWFWADAGLNKWADLDDLEAITRRVNGGLHGLEDRREWYLKACKELGA